jgi:hypothetical protein
MINVKVDADDVKNSLEELQVNTKNVPRKVVAAISSKIKSVTKKAYSGYLHKQTGLLYKSISRIMKKGKAIAYIYPTQANNKNNVRYGFVLAAGANILPKHDEYLTFKINGNWIRSKGVVIQPKNFIAEPADNFIGSLEYDKTIQTIIEKEVKKAEKKNV